MQRPSVHLNCTEYRFTVVPFGTAALRFLLYVVLQYHLRQTAHEFPDVVIHLQSGFYVDYVLLSNGHHPLDLATFKVRSEE